MRTPRLSLAPLFLALALGLPASVALAQSGKPPMVDAAAEAQAAGIRAMSDTDPTGRINQLLAARTLSDAALFALASTHPGHVEQLTSPRLRLAIDYLASLPSGDLNRVRRGETVIRSLRELRGEEYDLAVQLAETLGFKEKKLEALVMNPYESRIYVVSVRAKGKGGSQDSASIELAWPSTPERDEKSRDALSRHFGARPSRTGAGAGSLLALRNGSFDDGTALTDSWDIVDGAVLGTRTPVGEVVIDEKHALDGRASLRFFNDEKTRLFPKAIQYVGVQPGTVVRARAQHKAENVRPEYQQSDRDLYLELVFLDAMGNPVTGPARSYGRMSTHTWELLEVQQQAPPGATSVQVGVVSALSGTSWFDAVTLEVVQ